MGSRQHCCFWRTRGQHDTGNLFRFKRKLSHWRIEQEKLQIFGQSAGSYNTYSIVSLPQVPSLINAAICESSGGRSVQTNSSMQALGAAYAKTLGCFDTDVSIDSWLEAIYWPLINCLSQVQVDRWIRCFSAFCSNLVSIKTPNHTADIPFVFGNVDHLPLPNGTCNFTTAEKEILRTMISAWMAMMERGDPSIRGLE